MSELVQEVRAICEKTWAEEPEDVKNLLDRTKGYTDTWDSCFFPTLYAREETTSLAQSLLHPPPDPDAR